MLMKTLARSESGDNNFLMQGQQTKRPRTLKRIQIEHRFGGHKMTPKLGYASGIRQCGPKWAAATFLADVSHLMAMHKNEGV